LRSVLAAVSTAAVLAAVCLSGCGSGAPPQVTPISVVGGNVQTGGTEVKATINVARPELVPAGNVVWTTDPPNTGRFLQDRGYTASWLAPDVEAETYVLLKAVVTDTRGHSSESTARILIRPSDGAAKPTVSEPMRVSISIPDTGQVIGPGQELKLSASVTRTDVHPQYEWNIEPADAGDLLRLSGGQSVTWRVPIEVRQDTKVTIRVRATAQDATGLLEASDSVDFLLSPTGAGDTRLALPPTGLSFEYSSTAPRPNEVVEITVHYQDNGIPVDEILWKVESSPDTPPGELQIFQGPKAVWRAPQQVLANQTAVYVFTVTLRNRRGLTATGATRVAVRW